MLIASENLDKACTNSDQYGFGEDAGFSADKVYVDDATLDETFTDQQVFELEVDEESEGEQDEEDDDDDLEEVAQNIKGKEMLDLKLNVSVEGFIDSLLVRFLDTDIIMGAATFFPAQLSEGEDGLQIGESEIKEGESFNAYLLSPVHCDEKIECLIVQGAITDVVSKIGIVTMFTKLTRLFQTEPGKALDHPAYKIVKELMLQ
ncbi:hypothetical protein L7F22_031359 [Adiantum nelumboides]|nr:hypothetical protein [Adiantum nelumboides]